MSNAMRIYWDHNSTTPCAAEVVAKMLPYFTEEYGNSASPHGAGRVAALAVAEAREEVALAIGADSDSVIFTSGATESNNITLLGVAAMDSQRRKIVVSAIEHKSVLGPSLRLVDKGYLLETIHVDRNGVVDIEHAAKIIDDYTLIVSIQGANNETGVIQPVHKIVRLGHARGALVHCDATQMLGKVPTNLNELDVDMASFSAHKMYGPKGIGALFLGSSKTRAALTPIFFGGGQEHSLRPGTQNVPGIIGFGSACRLVHEGLDAEMRRLSGLRRLCEESLLRGISGSWVNGHSVSRLPGTISLTIPGIPADMLIANLSTVCVSDGSACGSGSPEPSHVLLAMQLNRSDAECTVRISLGRHTSEAEVKIGCQEIVAAAKNLKANLGQECALHQSVGRG